uniref:15-hydroxyprostaglandin dehydrogenase [NAD(+)] n=1 Tax=Leptochiton asellus TaxID=211853 RepID=A0A8D7ZEN4_9MOLL|nr:Retinal Dehydrogenase B (RDH-B) [Leptochiton asellus]
MKVKGCSAVVTGGASGIGKAICQALVIQEAQVCVVDVNASEGKLAVEELKLLHGEENVLFVQADVSSEDELKGAFDKAKSTFGRIDVVVNNAGILEEKDWRACVNVNLVGVISGTMLALEHMGMESGGSGGSGGVIINMASAAGLTPMFHFMPTYCATKAAVLAHTRSWSTNPRCARQGIRFNAVCPGIVQTPITRGFTQEALINLSEEEMAAYHSAKKIEPSRVAEVVLELIEDDTKNGAIIDVRVEGARRVEYPTKL